MAFRAHALRYRYSPPSRRRYRKPLTRRHKAEDPEVEELRRLLSPNDGDVLQPGQDMAAEELLPVNRRTVVVPRVIASCKTAHGVSVALDWARRHAIPLRGHSGGHSYEGYSSSSGLMVDVRPIKHVLPNNTTARIGAGARLYEIAEGLFTRKLAIPAGTCPTVGIAGIALGGGHGLSSRKLGLTIDNVVRLRFVGADCNEHIADENQNNDLFWALRGCGGGNLAIVTEFEFRVHPVGMVNLFRIRWKPGRSADVLEQWQRLMQGAPDDLGSVLVIGGGPNGLRPVRCSGQMLPADSSTLRKVLQPITDIPHLEFKLTTVSFLDAVKYFAGGDDNPRVFYKAKSDYVTKPLSSSASDDLLNALSRCEKSVDVIFEPYGGAVNRVASDATAFPHRGDTLFCMQYYAEWRNASSTAAAVSAVTAVYAAMRTHVSGRSYVNYADRDLTDWPFAYYAGNLRRLTAIKRQYDPNNIFDFPQAIPI